MHTIRINGSTHLLSRYAIVGLQEAKCLTEAKGIFRRYQSCQNIPPKDHVQVWQAASQIRIEDPV